MICIWSWTFAYIKQDELYICNTCTHTHTHAKETCIILHKIFFYPHCQAVVNFTGTASSSKALLLSAKNTTLWARLEGDLYAVKLQITDGRQTPLKGMIGHHLRVRFCFCFFLFLLKPNKFFFFHQILAMRFDASIHWPETLDLNGAAWLCPCLA